MNSYDMFIEVVELKSFSAAAKKLHLSPSTISKQIGLLEHRLGVQLFKRTTRSLATTQAGDMYYARCKDISARMEEAEAEIKDLSSQSSGKIHVTWPSVLSGSPIVDAVSEFCEMHPGIKVDVKVSNAMLNLTEEHVDFAFRVAELEDSSLVAIKLASIQPLVCAHPKLVAEYGIPTDFLEAMKYPQLIPTYYNLAQILRTRYPDFPRLDLDKHHTVDDIFALYHLAKTGMGATFIFKHMVAQELADGSLIDITQHDTLPTRSVYLVYPKLDYTPKPKRLFIDFLKTKFLR